MPEPMLPTGGSWRDRVRAGRAILGLAFSADPVRTIASLVMGSTASLFAPLFALGLGALTDDIVGGRRDGALRAASFLAGLWFLARLSEAVGFTLRMQLREKTVHLLDQRMMQLTTGIPGLEHLERPDHADRVELLRGQRMFLASAPDAMIWNVSFAIGAISAATVLSRISPWLLLLLPCSIPSMFAAGRATRKMQDLQERNAEPLRLMHHIAKIGTMPDHAGEVRVFGLGPELLRRHQELWADIDRQRLRTVLRNQIWLSGAWLIFAAGYSVALAFMANRALRGEASPGELVAMLNLSAQVRQTLVGGVRMASWLIDSLRATERYLWLTDSAKEFARRLTPAVPAAAPDRLAEGIRLEGVTFRYPGTDADVLRDVDLFLPAGSTVALVGDNGAGKSTLVKLLARFYEPTSGRILVDGRPLADIPVDDWRLRLAAGFQDFARPELMAHEAVGIGHVPQLGDRDAVVGALGRAVAADLAGQLPNGLDTQLGRTFDDGAELSGGQWQKLALGRAMMREEPLLLLLDEPTAALDAKAEHELFDRYSGAAHAAAARRGGITLLVSHRFSTVRTADLIVVIGDHGIVETGSHDELMAAAGTYAELYELQAASYR